MVRYHRYTVSIPMCLEALARGKRTVGQENRKTSQKRQEKELPGCWAQDDIMELEGKSVPIRETEKVTSCVLRDPVQTSVRSVCTQAFCHVSFCCPLIFVA